MLAHEYEGYLAACNMRDWGTLRGFFGPAVVVDGEVQTMERFIGDLVRLCVSHPDYHWKAVNVRQAEHIVTACLETSAGGLHGVEFVQYRSAGPMIVQVWSLGSSLT